MNKTILVLAAMLGALGVILGALGAHALKERLGIDGIKNFETGVKYHMFHVLALLVVQLFPSIVTCRKELDQCVFYPRNFVLFGFALCNKYRFDSSQKYLVCNAIGWIDVYCRMGDDGYLVF
jgi:uncharacterized membrane protein YgdD (TMEM256/DUF423 family)